MSEAPVQPALVDSALVDPDLIGRLNRSDMHEADLDALRAHLARRGIDADALTARLDALEVAVPTWGVGTGGTRFARFPGVGEPRGIMDKLDDCAVIQTLARCCPRVSPHFPWDADDPDAMKQKADALGLGFDAVNSNTFQDQPGQPHSYKHGSLTHVDPVVREQAVAHNVECIAIGRRIGSRALTVWIADGSNFPGGQDMGAAFERYVASMREVYAALPDDWRVFSEHKIFEPAFYSTVISDWGSSLLAAQELGPKAQCLVDLGHHAPTVNIEQIVARLAHAGKLGGFHFNDSKYGDDDLDTGSIAPYQLFLVFCELENAARRAADRGTEFAPAYMLDQSHNVTDPIESLLLSVEEVQRAALCAALVDRDALAEAQAGNDAVAATRVLKAAFRTEVTPLIAEWRRGRGGALDPVATFRASGYRARVAAERPAVSGAGGGIV